MVELILWQTICHPPEHKAGDTPKNYIGQNVSRKDKNKYLLSTVSIMLCLILIPNKSSFFFFSYLFLNLLF